MKEVRNYGKCGRFVTYKGNMEAISMEKVKFLKGRSNLKVQS